MAILPAVSSAMHGAVVPIAYGVGNGTSNGITFTNIPQTYQDLMIVVNYRSTAAVTLDLLYLYANNVTNGNYSSTLLNGDGSSATSTRLTSDYYGSQCGSTPGASATSGIFGSAIIHILNYTNSSQYKTAITRSASDLNGSGKTQLAVSLLRGTGAITSVSPFVYGNSGNIATGSTVTLYGIRSVGQ